MPIGQLQRSALRRALQKSFIEGTEVLLCHSHRGGLLKTRFAASWKWMLTISCIRFQGIPDDTHPKDIRKFAKDLGIHADNEFPKRVHQKLFSVAGINSMPDEALLLGLNVISDSSILKRVAKKYRDELGSPWKHILPEDIGSCYELIREIGPSNEGEKLELVQIDGRRNSGIHHTPHDVTEFMAKEAIRLQGHLDLDKFVVCDLAIGAGAFILQMSRIVSERTGVNIAKFLRDNAIGFDIDREVLLVAGLCFHLQSGCPQKVTEYNLHCLDSLGKSASERIIQKIGELGSSDVMGADITIGNPPYVRARKEDWVGSGFVSEDSRNLSSYFVEQATQITKKAGVVCQIVPLSLVQSKNCQSTRDVLESKCSKIQIRAFDCVPGYMFDQGKIGSNSNSSITQRVAVINCRLGQNESQQIRTTRLIRWGSKERDELFNSADTTVLPSRLRGNSRYPLLGDARMKRAYRHVLSTKRSIYDIESESGKLSLFIPKAIRYFATASRVDLEREQEMLTFGNRGMRDLAQVMLNSSFFYWYWRIRGNGFQISRENILDLPVPSISETEKRFLEIRRMAQRLHRNRDRLAVKKSNLGEIRNIKYDLDKQLMRDLDDLVYRLFIFSENYPFHACKSNNLSDYQTLWRIRSS